MAGPENKIDKQANRIPFESLEGEGKVASWSLPKVSQKGETVKSAAREALEKVKAKKQKLAQQKRESIEDVPAAKKPKPLTADELARISEDARKEGYDTGYQEGLAKGEQDGLARGQKDGEQKAFQQTKKQRDDETSRLTQISHALFQPMLDQQQHLEDIIVEMAVSLAKQILIHEIQQTPSALYRLVNHALSALPAGATNISVYLNEHDAALLHEILPNIDNWAIQIDNTLTSGGCRIATEESLVDFTVESRLNSFLDEIKSRGDIQEESMPEVESFRGSDEPVEKAQLKPADPETTDLEVSRQGKD